MLLEISDLVVKYGEIPALTGISLQVEEGKITTLIGANGAGKSTLLKTISGLIRPASGSIIYQGKDLTKIPPQRTVSEGIAHCPEGRKIFTTQTVMENLRLGGFTRKDKDQLEKDIEESLNMFPVLRERQNQQAGSLSGGEQQMLALCRALMSKPKLLMLDEPSMGLAPILVEQIFDIIKELHQAGTTILLVEQNAQVALSIADRAYVLETGTISMSGDAKELLSDPRVQKAYLGG